MLHGGFGLTGLLRLLLLFDAVDAVCRGVRGVQNFASFVEVLVEVVGGLFKIEIFDGHCGLPTNLLRDVLQHQFLVDVIQCNFACELANMCGELFWSTSLSGDSVEDVVDPFSSRLAVDVAEVVEEVVPILLRVLCEELIDGGVVAA